MLENEDVFNQSQFIVCTFNFLITLFLSTHQVAGLLKKFLNRAKTLQSKTIMYIEL